MAYQKLKDVQALDKDHHPKYKQTKSGGSLPIYAPPKGLAVIEGVHSAWHAAIWVQPRFVSDWLVMLGQEEQLYLYIHEHKVERQRWIRSISLQTTDPTQD